jgi:hypothetical protein
MFEWLASPEAWVALATLTSLCWSAALLNLGASSQEEQVSAWP